MNHDLTVFSQSRVSGRPAAAKFWRFSLCLVVLVACCLLAAPLHAQEGEEEEETGPPEPEDITLVTDDGVLLKCTYYAGTEGEDSVPVVLVHAWEGNRLEFADLATYLQAQGHAVIVPDLRGHGDSTVRRIEGADDQELDYERMNRSDIEAVVTQDLQAVKKYLMERNNDGELNIDLLTVVGSEEGALIALNWCLVDWSWPQLPARRQGQDVKAFVLISPPTSFRGLTTRQALANQAVSEYLSAMIVVGEQDTRTAGAARRLNNSLERQHGPPPTTEAEQIEHQDLFYVPLDTSLQGTELLTARGLGLPGKIAGFIDLRLVRKADEFPWQERRSR